MPNIQTQFEELRIRIEERNEPDMPVDGFERLCVSKTNDFFHIDFYGNPFEESYEELLSLISVPTVAGTILSITFRGPDEGANGTRNWNLRPLIESDAQFSNLESFAIQLTKAGDHNRTIVAADYDEDGVISKLVAKSPCLRELTVPSAPSTAFFESVGDQLRFLSVDAGYDHQQFVRNLASSQSFPNLRCLEWGEYNETYMDDFKEHCTPSDDYRLLFSSTAFQLVARFVWRNPALNDDEIRELRKLSRPDLQLLVIRTRSEYLK